MSSAGAITTSTTTQFGLTTNIIDSMSDVFINLSRLTASTVVHNSHILFHQHSFQSINQARFFRVAQMETITETTKLIK